MTRSWTPLDVLAWTTDRFAAAGLAAARLEAQVLLAHVLGCDRVALYTGFDRPLDAGELAAYRQLIRRRLAGEPTAYLVGTREFWSLGLAVDARVLVPRPETELVVDVALQYARRCGGAIRVADVATGSGAIAIALARELPDATVLATDVSPDALAVASHNVEMHDVADRVTVRCGDLFAALAGEPPFDLVVANLPYVPRADVDRLAVEVRCEPRIALDGGEDGLALLRRFARDVPGHVAAGGAVVLEHGHDQGAAVRSLLAASFADVVTCTDLAGHDRVTWGRVRDPRGEDARGAGGPG